MLNKPMMPNTTAQINTLRSLNLKQEFFITIGQKILTAYRSTTENDTKTAAGTQGYLTGVRAMRDELKPHGWKKHCDSNIELTLNEELRVQIMVSSGDLNTGKESGPQPKTKNPKGGETRVIVKENNQLPLFPHLEPKKKDASETIPTWIFLYHVDIKQKEMRMELSFPNGINTSSQRIDSWKERILLPALQFEPTPTYTPDFGPEVEFDIKRKI